MHERGGRIREILYFIGVETVYVFTLHKSRGLPVGVAVYQPPFQPAVVLPYLVEGYLDHVLRADADYRRRVEQVDVLHLQRLEPRREYLLARVYVGPGRGQYRSQRHKECQQPSYHTMGVLPCATRYSLARVN